MLPLTHLKYKNENDINSTFLEKDEHIRYTDNERNIHDYLDEHRIY